MYATLCKLVQSYCCVSYGLFDNYRQKLHKFAICYSYDKKINILYISIFTSECYISTNVIVFVK